MEDEEFENVSREALIKLIYLQRRTIELQENSLKLQRRIIEVMRCNKKTLREIIDAQKDSIASLIKIAKIKEH